MEVTKENDVELIKDLMKVLGIDDVPNVVGFSLEVNIREPVVISVKQLAGRDGVANFIRTFPFKCKLTPLNEKALDKLKETKIEN